MEQRINPLNSNQAQRRQGNPSARQRVTSQNGSSPQTQRTIGSTNVNYAVAKNATALHVGDVLRGEITDLRNNQITITLENNTMVRGQISNSSSYSIGEFGSFRLSDISGSTLYLEHISKGYTDNELYLINKALDEANMPPTEHNQAAVKALMDNLLPINRSSIQSLMQQAYDYHTEDMNTLAVMNRLMMNIDEYSVTQFSNYRNNNYQLLEPLENFSKDIPSLLATLSQNSSSSEMVASFGKNLLGIGLTDLSFSNGNATLAILPKEVQEDILHMLSNAPLTEDIQEQLDNRTLSLQDTLTLLRDAALNKTFTPLNDTSAATLTEQLNQINQVLEPVTPNQEISQDFVKTILTLEESSQNTLEEGTDSMEKTSTSPEDLSIDAKQPSENDGKSSMGFGRFLHSLSENAKNTLSDTLQALRSTPQGAVSSTQESPSSIGTLLQTYETIARNQDYLNTYLSVQERNDLLNQLQNMPISKTMLTKIASGEATTKDVLTVIFNTISLTDSEQIQELFSSEGFEKLFQRHLQSAWTVTPEQLKEGDLSAFYQKLHTQMEQYKGLIESTLSGEASKDMSGFAHDIESNISFMKNLNEMFSYFQIPLKLPSQDANSDLYVYTKKEKLKQNPKKCSVLLHLDMENLGTIDVKLNKDNHDILADFSLNDKESVALFQANADMLKEGLNRQGFACQIHINEKEKPSPTVDDFINAKVNTHATTDMKRFSFDIRA